MNWLRRLEEAKDIPIIVITGGDPAKYKDRALAAGAVSFFHKPINNDELLTVIRRPGEGRGAETSSPRRLRSAARPVTRPAAFRGLKQTRARRYSRLLAAIASAPSSKLNTSTETKPW